MKRRRIPNFQIKARKGVRDRGGCSEYQQICTDDNCKLGCAIAVNLDPDLGTLFWFMLIFFLATGINNDAWVPGLFSTRCLQCIPHCAS